MVTNNLNRSCGKGYKQVSSVNKETACLLIVNMPYGVNIRLVSSRVRVL